MAIISCKEIWQGRDGDWSTSKTGTVRRYTRIWRVVTDSRYDNAEGVVAAMGALTVPIYIGAAFPSDTHSWLRSLKPKNESFSPYVWLVTGLYSSEYEVQQDPLAEPAKISWRTQSFQRPYAKDRENRGITNSIGEYPSPMLQGDDSRWQCTIRKNVAAVPAIVTTYKDAINTDSFTVQGVTIGVRCGKIMSIEISDWQRAPNDSIYYVFTWSFAVNPDTWDPEYPNLGLHEKKDNKIIPCMVAKQVVRRPVQLTIAGAMIPSPTPDTVVYLTAKLYKLKTFNGVLPLS